MCGNYLSGLAIAELNCQFVRGNGDDSAGTPLRCYGMADNRTCLYTHLNLDAPVQLTGELNIAGYAKVILVSAEALHPNEQRQMIILTGKQENYHRNH